MVECNLAKVDVAGSNPVSRSKNPLANAQLQSWAFSSGFLEEEKENEANRPFTFSS